MDWNKAEIPKISKNLTLYAVALYLVIISYKCVCNVNIELEECL
jgi:hypothetical protein